MESAEEVCSVLCTLGDYVRWGASRFAEAGLVFGHGTDNAFDEAYYLVLSALHLPRSVPDVYLAATMTALERREVYALLRRRLEERRPAPYLVGEAWFAGLAFDVDERVLVPRSPLAELIESRFSPFVEEAQIARILDLGTGSGCIAVACALAFPRAAVDAVDVSMDALSVARRNTQRHGLERRVRCLQSDVFSALEGVRYDLIVSNPPYVERAQVEALPPEYRHEPVLALTAGEDGLDVVRRLLRDALEHLREDGIIVVEVGAAQSTLIATYPQVPFLWLEFQHGGEGVFVLTAPQLREYQHLFVSFDQPGSE